MLDNSTLNIFYALQDIVNDQAEQQAMFSFGV